MLRHQRELSRDPHDGREARNWAKQERDTYHLANAPNDCRHSALTLSRGRPGRSRRKRFVWLRQAAGCGPRVARCPVTIRAGLAAEPPFAQGKPSRFHPPTPHRSCRCHPLRPPRAHTRRIAMAFLSRRMGTTIARLTIMPLVGIQFRCPSPRGICSVNVPGLLGRLMRGLGLAWSPPALRRRNRFGLHTQRLCSRQFPATSRTQSLPPGRWWRHAIPQASRS